MKLSGAYGPSVVLATKEAPMLDALPEQIEESTGSGYIQIIWQTVAATAWLSSNNPNPFKTFSHTHKNGADRYERHLFQETKITPLLAGGLFADRTTVIIAALSERQPW